MKIAILGGTGNEGFGLGLRWAVAGHEIIIGSRQAGKGARAADDMLDKLPEGHISGTDNLTAAAEADIAVLAVPYEAQEATLSDLKEALEGKLLITVVAPLKEPKGRVWLAPGGSAAIEAKSVLGEGVRIVAAFQSISAMHLKDPHHTIDSDVLVCGDKKADRDIAVELAAAAGMRGVHAGPLQNTPVIEGLASVMIAINVRYKVKDAGMRITGIDNG